MGSPKKTRQNKNKELPGSALEKTVARIQQMMDSNSIVSHDEKLTDRLGNVRQYDVVIRGQFGGRPILGIIECKDHNRKKGPSAVEAFAKKTEHLNANMKMMVSRKGFTEQALKIAKHEGIACLSLPPDNPEIAGFSLGEFWYGKLYEWTNFRLRIEWAESIPALTAFSSETVKWKGEPIINWFLREFLTTHGDETKEDFLTIKVEFIPDRELEFEGSFYKVKAVSCTAQRVCRKKRRWMRFAGDGFFDWHENNLVVPEKTRKC